MSIGLKLDDGKYLLVGSFIDRDNPTNIAVVTDEDNIHKLTLQFESGNNIDFIYDEDVKKYGMGLTIIEKKTDTSYIVTDFMGIEGTLTRIGDEIKEDTYNLSGTNYDVDKPTKANVTKNNNISQINIITKDGNQTTLDYDADTGKYGGTLEAFKQSDNTYIIKGGNYNNGKLELYVYGEKINPGRYLLNGTKYTSGTSAEVIVTEDNIFGIINSDGNILLDYEEKYGRYQDIYAKKNDNNSNSYTITDNLGNTGTLFLLQSRISEGEYTISNGLYDSNELTRVTIFSNFDIMIIKNSDSQFILKYNSITAKYGDIYAYSNGDNSYTLKKDSGETSILKLVNLFETQKVKRGNVLVGKELIHSTKKDENNNFMLYFKAGDENSILDVGGNTDGTRGFIVVIVYDYYKNHWRQLDRTSMQNGFDYRGRYVEIKNNNIREPSEWDGISALKFEILYINSLADNYVDAIYYINNEFTRFTDIGATDEDNSSTNISDVSISCTDMNKLITMVQNTQGYVDTIRTINNIENPYDARKLRFSNYVESGYDAANEAYEEIKKYKCETKTAPIYQRKIKQKVSMRFANMK